MWKSPGQGLPLRKIFHILVESCEKGFTFRDWQDIISSYRCVSYHLDRTQ